MRQMILIIALLVLESFSAAQQPDIRVRLLSLYRLSEVKIQPVPGARAEWSSNSMRSELAAELAVHARGDSIEVAGRTVPKVALSGDLRILAEHASPQHIHGAAEISAKDGALQIVVSMPVDDYVAAVLQGETAGDMPLEALKALAVAIRSYATRFRERHKDEGFDFCDSTHCQYLRLDVQPAVREAVTKTAGELLWDRGTPLAAYYHKDCGGRTEDAAAVWPDQASPALTSHADPYCVRASDPWQSEVSRADLDRAIAAAGLAVLPGWNRIAIVERTSSGRAKTLRFSVGNAQSGASISASTLRFAVGRTLGWNTLKSDWYDLSAQGDHFIFRGRGVGHGVGLCQTGAVEAAREGKMYRDILAFYYPGAMIGRSAQGIPWEHVQTEAFELRVVNATDRTVARTAAHSALEWAIAASGLSLHSLPLIEVYPTVAMFRDATGEPGWVAASTRHQRMRVQSPSVLHEKFESVLRHEFLHMLVEDNAAPNTPLWFREGLVVYLGGDPPPAKEVTMTGTQIDEAITSRRSEAEMREAYAEAATTVRDLDRRNGRKQLIAWLRDGLPENLRGGTIVIGAEKASH
jgi:stage II sporulation protein D